MPRVEELPDKLTREEVADILEITPGSVAVMVSRGQLRYVGEVGSRLIETASLVEYVNHRYSGKESAT